MTETLSEDPELLALKLRELLELRRTLSRDILRTAGALAAILTSCEQPTARRIVMEYENPTGGRCLFRRVEDGAGNELEISDEVRDALQSLVVSMTGEAADDFPTPGAPRPEPGIDILTA